ncbi:Flp pilus assembly protein CpaB [Benzoatithermus flavus]|uniref:Flp pilus assembly protein CpaB n=1 Tax=Benzoatithermus flavus TaxID=3108223 RepID=A0ABU8Y0M3_9PROT
MRRLFVPVLALLLAGTSALAVRAWLQGHEQPAAVAVETPRQESHKAVLVAASDLPAGTFIRPDQLRWQEWPDVSTPDSYVVRGEAQDTDLTGAVLRRPVATGEPIVALNLVRPGDRGFLAAVLDPGMRAVSVPIDEASGNAGLILPGDRVDLILTQTLGAPDIPSGVRRVSETILEDVRVIAMGRRLRSESGDEGSSGSQVRTATLETTPAGAEKVALVTELGKLALSLRSLALTELPPPRQESGRPTWDTDVSPALRLGHEPSASLLVIRGDTFETVNVRRGAGS